MTFTFFLLLGCVSGLFAGLMAFLIFFNEYQKHHLTGWRLWKESLAAGAITFAVFVLLSVTAGHLLLNIL